MASQAKLFFTKLFGNVFIFLSLSLSLSLSLALADQAWSVCIDPLATLVIAGSILASAIGVFSSSVCDLLDGTLEEKDKLDIMRELVLHFERYEVLYGVRSRRAGNRVFIDIAAIRAGVMCHFKNASVTVVLGSEQGAASVTAPPIRPQQSL